MVQLNLKKNIPYVKKQYVPNDDVLCQWDFAEQTEELVRLLLYTRENYSRKFHAWVYLDPVSKQRVNLVVRNGSLDLTSLTCGRYARFAVTILE
jgi:hypothetical protein